MRTHLNKKLAKALSLSPYEGERADNPENASTFGKRLNIGKTVCVVSILFTVGCAFTDLVPLGGAHSKYRRTRGGT